MYEQKLMDDVVRKLAWDQLQKNTVTWEQVDMITGEALGPEVDYTRKF